MVIFNSKLKTYFRELVTRTKPIKKMIKIKNNSDTFIVKSYGYIATWYKNIKLLIIIEHTTKQKLKCVCNNKSTVFKKIDEFIPYN